MEDREMPRMHKYGESKATQIVMATVPHVTAWAGLTKYHADGVLLDWVYNGYLVFPGGKVRPGRAADHSPPSSVAVIED